MNSPGTLLDHLPAVYRSWEALAPLLAAFEEVLFGPDRDGAPGLSQRIDAIPDLFAIDPHRGVASPDAFVPWLAQWVAFTPREGLGTDELRRIVAAIVPLYPMRGTKAYVEAVLRLCVPQIEAVSIDDEAVGLTLGRSTLGVDSLLVAERPFWFSVTVRAPADAVEASASADTLAARQSFERKLRRLIDFAKPAHTAYELRCEFDPAGPSGSRGRPGSA